MNEPFGPEYVRPAQRECPRCHCCSVDLCERGRNSVLQCQGHTSPEAREVVTGCPCSAETTKHTAAWRAAQVRVTRMARELPLAPEAETMLRELAGGKVAPAADAEAFKQLKLRKLAADVHGMPAITGLGHTYLAGRDDVRAPVPVRVLDVDKATRTARVEVAAWRQGEPVTVLMDQVVSDSGLDVDSLPGRWLEADANCDATVMDPDRLVLTGFRASAPVPSGLVADGGESP